eukprot:scaffold39041_cov57-Attheya_sp.AAC.2
MDPCNGVSPETMRLPQERRKQALCSSRTHDHLSGETTESQKSSSLYYYDMTSGIRKNGGTTRILLHRRTMDLEKRLYKLEYRMARLLQEKEP